MTRVPTEAQAPVDRYDKIALECVLYGWLEPIGDPNGINYTLYSLSATALPALAAYLASVA